MAFRTNRPLRFGDCDPSGIVYFPSYLNILVGVIEEFFAAVGAPWKELVAVRRVGRSSLDLEHKVSAAGTLLWSARHSVVATSLDTHNSLNWPDDLRAALETHLETADA